MVVAKLQPGTMPIRVVQILTQCRCAETVLNGLCWRDIYVELAKLVGIDFNPDLLPKDRTLRNCERFIDSLATLKPYSSDFERERAIAKYRGLSEKHRRVETIFDDYLLYQSCKSQRRS